MERKADVFRGCLLGCAVGDAVGAPVEKKDRAQVRSYVLQYVQPRSFEEAPPSTFERFPFGHYTDDTQFMRELMLSLASTSAVFDGEDYARRLQDLYKNDHIAGVGGSTRKALKRLSAGVPWRESGVESAGNGSAMRVAPLGLVYDSVEEILAAARLQSILTHTSVEAQISAAAVSLAAFYASGWIVDVDISRVGFGLKVAEALEPLSPVLARYLRKVSGYVREDLDDTNLICLSFLQKEVQDKTNWPGISPYCVSSVLWAFYSFLKTPHSYWDTIQTALWPGGDVDTTAAMAGALSGIHNGTSQLPQEVLELLTDNQGITAEGLYAVADTLKDVALSAKRGLIVCEAV